MGSIRSYSIQVYKQRSLIKSKRTTYEGGSHGAGAGLGASIAERLASEGYAVALLDQDGDAASRSAEKLTGASAFQVDVSNPEQVADVFSRIGAVDLLVNNAGIARFGPLLEQSAADMQAVININLMGTALCAQQAARQMTEQGSGCIINCRRSMR